MTDDQFEHALPKARRCVISCRVHQRATIHDGRPEDRLPIRMLRAVDVCFARMYHQLSVRSPHQFPRTGAGIFVCNHTSALDPLLIQSASPRLIVWMMAKEYYDLPILGRIFRTLEVIPVDRTGRDTAATRAALRALSHGRILGVFPEGRIEPSRELLPFQTGVAMMATKTQLPVYPAYLDGTQRGKEMLGSILIPNRASIAFGPPKHFGNFEKSRQGFDELTMKIKSAVADLSNKSCGRPSRW
jgi:1-acyl-sn-glycerol-3-phosphate acyltransferase